ncbi:unnamed protein product [Pleuronectes platessa]|uniref:Uncharacterized protein n=1 Tax=Pleuronectes platessa TaxID=8262 RepID=A0A9N7U781_PLEPL|nr:unnamed protein product [Pleuronectes platessa]
MGWGGGDTRRHPLPPPNPPPSLLTAQEIASPSPGVITTNGFRAQGALIHSDKFPGYSVKRSGIRGGNQPVLGPTVLDLRRAERGLRPNVLSPPSTEANVRRTGRQEMEDSASNYLRD